MLIKEDKKNKICFVSIMGYPLYNQKCKRQFFGGGAAVQLHILAKQLAIDENFDVNVITGNYNLTKNRLELLNNIKLYNVHPIKRKPFYYFFSLINIFFFLVRIKPNVVIQMGGNKVSGVCALYCKLFKKKFLFSIANLTDVNGKNERNFLGKFFKYGIDNATHIIAQNKNQIRELEKYKKRKYTNITIIKNSYKIIDEPIRDKKLILWAARAINWKRPELFLKLAEKFPKEEFLMICNKTDEKIHNIKYWNTLFEKASKISNLIFLEFIPFNEINQYFKKAKIFVNTSIFEGFPNTFIHSFINKTPVISINVNPDELFTKNKIGFWCNNNFNIMVEKIKELLRNEVFFKQYSQNCIEYCKKYHNVKNNIKIWSRLIYDKPS